MKATRSAARSSVRPRAIAALALAAAACGSDPPTFVDAGPLDATGADATTATARITVHVNTMLGDGAVDPTATVFFVDPDGRIAAEGHPDAGGTIIRDVGVGGSVTVGWGPEPAILTTILGVAHDDELWFGRPDERRDLRVNLTVPARAGNIAYSVHGPCMNGGNTATTIIAGFWLRCGATHPLLIGSSSNVGLPTWYLSAPAVTPTAGGTIALEGTWSQATPTSITLTGIPDEAGVVSIDRSVLAGGTDVARLSRFNLPVVGGGVTTSFDVPPGFGDGARLEVLYQRSNRRYRVGLFRPVLSEAAPLDVAPAVPDLTAVELDGATVSWTLAGAGDHDATVVDLADVEGEALIASWRVVAPPGPTSVTLPVLPAPFDRRDLPFEAITLVETTHLAGAAFRARAGTGAWIDAAPIPAPSDTRWIRVAGPHPAPR